MEANDPQLKECKSECEERQGTFRFEQCRDKRTATDLAQEADSKAEREEAAAPIRSILNHRQWLKEGAASGLGRQHRMSRTENGWIPSRQGCGTPVDGEDDEAWFQQAASPMQEVVGIARSPMGTQREGDEQRLNWCLQWDNGQLRKEPEWPAVVLNQIPEMTIGMFTAACMSFQCGTGLGGDALNPRALARLPRSLLLLVVLFLMAAEVSGEWPQLVGRVVLVLLPKTDGGRRPIGLFPCLPRFWPRARRNIVVGGSKQTAEITCTEVRGKGSEVAAWRHAARTELAAMDGTSYAQGLLDLVNAYERIPPWVLLRDANKHGYPVWLLRLAVTAYRLSRMIKIDQVVSLVVVAARGIYCRFRIGNN